MHTLEPLCNLEQSLLLKELKFNEETEHSYCDLDKINQWVEEDYNEKEVHNIYPCYCARPTISMARNWVFREYGIWIYAHHIIDCYSGYMEKQGKNLFDIDIFRKDPHTAESECLTEILKHLKAQKHATT
jgi:hypothetical protein